MATAFKLLDTPLPSPPRPAVRVVFDAAAQAVDNHVATLPAAVRDATLDELALGDMARATIALARRDLSAPMFDAFLTWGERGIMANTSVPGEPDETFDARVDAGSLALGAVLDTMTGNGADAAIKLYAAAAGHDSRSSDLGPVIFPDGFDWGHNADDGLPEQVLTDLLVSSECARSLNYLLVRAWQVNGIRMSFNPVLGELLANAFRDAPRSFPAGLTPDFHQLLDRAYEAERLVAEHTRTTYDPARARIAALIEGVDPADLPAVKEAAHLTTGIREIVRRNNELASASVDAMDAAINRTPVTIAEFQAQCRFNIDRDARMDDVLLVHAKALLAVAPPAETAWNMGLASYQAACVAAEAYRRDVHDPAQAALEREAPNPCMMFDDEAQDGSFGRFFADPAKPDAWAHHPRLHAKAMELIEAHHAHKAARERLGIEAIDDEYQRLLDVQGELSLQLLLTPAPTRSALLWKLENLFSEDERDTHGEGSSYSAKVTDAYMADARRLLAEVAR